MIHASIHPFRVYVKQEYLFDMDPAYVGKFEEGKVFALSSYPGEAITFQVLLNGGAVYSYLPAEALQLHTKLIDQPLLLNDLVYHNCPGAEIAIHVYSHLKGPILAYFKHSQKWMKGTYKLTIDWYKENELFHLVKLENGQLAFVPSHKIKFRNEEGFMPPYRKLHKTWNVEVYETVHKQIRRIFWVFSRSFSRLRIAYEASRICRFQVLKNLIKNTSKSASLLSSGTVSMPLLHKLDPKILAEKTVQNGELFRVDLLNAFGKTFETAEEMEAFFHPENEEIKKALGHPCTGPIAFQTSRTTLSLQITIHEIGVTRAYQCLSKSSGLFPETAKNKRRSQIVDVNSPFSLFEISLEPTPSLGFLATIGKKEIRCSRAGKNGGNIDLNYLRKGSKITLPVTEFPPRIAIGDLHLLQGNGEASGTGIEADGFVILSIQEADFIPFPVIESEDQIIIVGWGDTLEESLRCGVENTIFYLQQQSRFQKALFADLYAFVSAISNMVIGNSTGKCKTCGIVFQRGIIA